VKVIGIDPGLLRTGYAVVDARRPMAPRLIEAGLIRLPPRASVASRLVQLHDDLADLMAEHSPGVVSVEEVFVNAKFARTAVTMAHARGVVLLSAQRAGASLVELAPATIKKAIAGNGQATKAQMQRAVAAQCGLAAPPKPPDVADAIAIALCACLRGLRGR
jgi:crossover junction endodeoxyribonuclease RuvC